MYVHEVHVPHLSFWLISPRFQRISIRRPTFQWNINRNPFVVFRRVYITKSNSHDQKSQTDNFLTKGNQNKTKTFYHKMSSRFSDNTTIETRRSPETLLVCLYHTIIINCRLFGLVFLFTENEFWYCVTRTKRLDIHYNKELPSDQYKRNIDRCLIIKEYLFILIYS